MPQSGEAVAGLSRPQVWQPAADCERKSHTHTQRAEPIFLLKDGSIKKKNLLSPAGFVQHQAWHVVRPFHHQRPPERDRLRGAQPAGQRGGIGLAQGDAHPLV